MQELLPVAIGVVVGLVSGRLLGRRDVFALLLAAPLFGVLVAWGVGELEESFAFALLDTAVVGVTALIVVAAQRLGRGEQPDNPQEVRGGGPA